MNELKEKKQIIDKYKVQFKMLEMIRKLNNEVVYLNRRVKKLEK